MTRPGMHIDYLKVAVPPCNGGGLSLLLGLVILSPGPFALGNAAAGQPSEALPMEHRAFEQTRETDSDDTPGVLKYGGYSWRDVTVVRRDYRALERKLGGADVEIVVHSANYPYVIKDFFGTFRTAASGDPSKRKRDDISILAGMVNEGKGQWWFKNWDTPNRVRNGTICVSVAPKGEGAYGGIAGWYSQKGDRLATVMIRFDQLDGVPEKLIDEFLSQYPSSVAELDFRGETWVADDVRKWVHLLRLQKLDRELFQIAAARLAEYDPKLFGVDPARLQAEDPATFDAAVEALKSGAERWLSDRQANKREPRGE